MSTTPLAQKKQSRILEVATELFLQRGYEAVSLDDILERVGGSKTTLYSYYGGKEGLFGAFVKKMCHDKLAPIRDTDVTNLSPQEGLNAIGRKLLNLVTDPTGKAFYRMMIAEAERFPQLAAEFYAAGPATMIRLIGQNIDRWQKIGLLRNGHSETLAVQFIGILMGNFNVATLLGLEKTLSEKEIKDWVTKGVILFLEGTAARTK